MGQEQRKAAFILKICSGPTLMKVTVALTHWNSDDKYIFWINSHPIRVAVSLIVGPIQLSKIQLSK